ncbi:MAG: radical SAM/SPASM domain-containing protein [Bacilli bacterium]
MRFKKVYIEITNLCNLKCNFCPSPTLERTRKSLTMNEFQHIIAQVRPYTDYVYFHVMGEPFLNKNLPHFLDHCAEVGLKVNITTNGTLIERVQDMLLQKNALRQVNISLHSFEANEAKMTMEQYVKHIATWTKRASEQGIITSIRLWNMDTQELKACNALNDDLLSLLEQHLELDVRISEALQQKMSLKLKERVYLNMAEKFAWPDMNRDVIDENVFCYALRDQVGVLVDGTVVPCCLDSEGKIPLGNLFTTSLQDILAGERATAMYEGFSRNCAVEELCKRCGYAKRHKR